MSNKISKISRQEIINSESPVPFHVFTQSVEKRKIFALEEDCFRFIFQMYAANVGHPVFNLHRKDVNKIAKDLLNGKDFPGDLVVKEHPPLVNILSFALVINHNHFILSANVKKGVSIYMQKLNLSFAKYFNMKYKRQGSLFLKPFKVIPVKDNVQLDRLVRYVNIKNPIDVYQPGWREKGLDNTEELVWFLNNYQFSSFPDVFGKRKSKILNFQSVSGLNIEENEKHWKDFIEGYLKGKIVHNKSLFLEND